MKKILLLTIIIFSFSQAFANITIEPVKNKNVEASQKLIILPPAMANQLASLKMKEIQRLAGRKLTLKEKIGIKLYQLKLKKQLKKGNTKPNNGTTAMILGIVGLASMIIPYAAFAAVPCIILALVFGYNTKKHYPDDKHAKTAIVLGWIGAGLIILAAILVLAIIASLGM